MSVDLVNSLILGNLILDGLLILAIMADDESAKGCGTLAVYIVFGF